MPSPNQAVHIFLLILVFLFPVVTAATSFGPLGTIAFLFAVIGSYLSFLFYIDWSRYTIEPDDAQRLCLRVIFVVLVGFLTHRLAVASRVEERRYFPTVYVP